VAAYLKSSESVDHIDWTLDALTNKYSRNARRDLVELFGHTNVPSVGIDEVETLIREIDDFEPDLVICDFEPIVANIAKSMGLRLWYCSPIHLLDGVEWEPGQLRYASLLAKTRQTLLKLPEAEKTFVYSPFGDVFFRPNLRQGYEWVRPYHCSVEKNVEESGIAVVRDLNRISVLSKILNCIPPFDLTLFSPFSYNLSHLETQNICNVERYRLALSNCKWLFTTGETSFISDGIYNKINRLCIAPDLADPEALLNSILCRQYDIGDDIGQVEYLESYAVEAVENSYNNDKIVDYLSAQTRETLHERIMNEVCSI
jgi:hypothetical protein